MFDVVSAEPEAPPVREAGGPPAVVADVVCDGRSEGGPDRGDSDDDPKIEHAPLREVPREGDDQLTRDRGDDALDCHQEKDPWIAESRDDGRDPLRESKEQGRHARRTSSYELTLAG